MKLSQCYKQSGKQQHTVSENSEIIIKNNSTIGVRERGSCMLVKLLIRQEQILPLPNPNVPLVLAE